MAPVPTSNPQIPPPDPTVLSINTTMSATTQVVNTSLDHLLDLTRSPSTGNGDIDRSLEQIRRDLESLTSTRSAEQDEIRRLLETALNNEVLQHLTKEIERQINVCIDTTVARLIEEELDNHVPKKLREQVDKQRLDLLQLQVEIHNSEARRANSFIKTQKHFGENLHHLLDSKGRSSDIFPKTVNDLLSYDDAKVLQLVVYYGMRDPQSKVPNLNWFLRTIGVTYQSNLLG